MTQIEKIKAEIERRKKDIENTLGDFAGGRRFELNYILEIIKSLEKEQQ